MGSQLYGRLAMAEDWRGDLEIWLTPFLAALRHKTRVRLCPAYIAGLIGPGDRKSVQPMAARDGEFGYDQLHHFVANGAYSDEAGHLYRFEVGHRTDLKRATLPI
jgi:SRSO17 transposase